MSSSNNTTSNNNGMPSSSFVDVPSTMMTHLPSILVINGDTPEGDLIVRQLLHHLKQTHQLQYGHVLTTVRDIAHSGDLLAIGAYPIQLHGSIQDERKWVEMMKKCKVHSVIIVPDASSKEMVDHTKRIIDICKNAGVVERCLMMSIVGADEKEVKLAKNFMECERHLCDSKLHHAIVRTVPWQQTLFLFREQLAEGRLQWPLREDVRLTLIDVHDISRFIGHLFAHGGKEQFTGEGKLYRLTGPKVHTMEELCDELEQQLGFNIRYEKISRQDFERDLHKSGKVPQEIASKMADLMELAARGKLNFVSDDEKKSTGHEAKKFDEFLKENRNLLKVRGKQ